MTARIRTKIALTVATAAVIAVALAPYASGGQSRGRQVQIPSSLSHLHEPGSTGYVPAAGRVRIPSRLAGFREPGSTVYVQGTGVSIPARLAHLREPGSTGFVPVAGTVASTAQRGTGLDWASALVGAGAALGIVPAAAGALMLVRRRRTLRPS